MQIRFYVVDFELPRCARKALATVPALIIIAAAAMVHADVQFSDLQAHSQLKAEELNSRFNAVKNAVNALDTRMTADEAIRFGGAAITTSGCATNQSANSLFASSGVHANPGECVMTFSNAFSEPPNCQCTVIGGGIDICEFIEAPTTNAVHFEVMGWNVGAAKWEADDNRVVNIVCVGTR